MKNRLKRILLFAVFGLLIHSPVLSGREAPVNKKLISLKQDIYRFNFDRASGSLDSLLKKDPQNHTWLFYSAFVDFMNYSQDVTKTYLAPRIKSKLKTLTEKLDRTLGADPDDIDALYYSGLSYGLMGLYYVVRDDYIKAYWYGSDGLDFLEEVVEKDPQFIDARLGLGLFHYYVDLMPGMVKFFAAILGYGGSREKGLAEMRLVAEKGEYFKVEARFALGVLSYFIENDLDASLKWFAVLRRDYPENPLVNLMYGIYYRQSGYISEAKEYTEKVIKPGKFSRFGSIVHGAYYNYAQCYYLENKPDSALMIFAEMNALPTRKSTYFRATIDYWLGYLNEIMGRRKQAVPLYRRVADRKITKRWYDYAKSYLALALSPLEIGMIYFENRITLNRVSSPETEVFFNKIDEGKLNLREKGRLYYLKGLVFDKNGDYHRAKSFYLKAAEEFDNIDFVPLYAETWLRLLKMALLNGDLFTAEKAYEEVSGYDERYFQLKVRKWWAELKRQRELRNSN
jgi:tetratricopeptide (TPR) repeat protein